MRIGSCLAPLGSLRIGGGPRVARSGGGGGEGGGGCHAAVGHTAVTVVGWGRVERSLWRWGSFPLHWRGGREAGLLRQRQIRRLIHWPWLLHIVVNGWLASVTNGELGLSLSLPLAASDRAVDETAARKERAAQQRRVAVLATWGSKC